jgi:uncharacterized protein (TIGR00251 family)
LKKLKVRVKTGQRSDEIVGFDSQGVLVISVRAPRREGKANRSLLELLSGELRVPKSEIRIVRGSGSVHKLLHLPDAAKLPPRLDT